MFRFHRLNLLAVLLSTLSLCGALSFAPARADEDSENQTFKYISDPGLAIFTTAGIGLPLLSGGRDGRQQSLRTTDAVLVGALAETALKRIVREKRPNAVPGEDTDDFSFPSGHATTAFVVATMQSHYHPKQAPYWYAGAALIAASRVRTRSHYVHDVLAGAALGYGIARWELSRPHGLLLRPFIEPGESAAKRASSSVGGGGFGFVITRQF